MVRRTSGYRCSLPPDVYKDSIMVMRNRNMALKADSMMHDHTIFLMVGAAHLPFPTGVLHLLQEKGYKVRPVETVVALKESR
ncbi:TraB/GumN family protein [Parapedobacter sp. 2B3]|uniref:TraB/GumN family protein n=1 Tax=Parapedobacter sp. 2B3 TaxID=3342381 RepID=UPI0035B64F73